MIGSKVRVDMSAYGKPDIFGILAKIGSDWVTVMYESDGKKILSQFSIYYIEVL